MKKSIVCSFIVLFCASLLQAEINPRRAHFNYQMFCQGCHTGDGMGGASVPRLKGYIGHFMTLPEGREFLVRVPGSANSSLDDEQLAEVLNWIIVQFGEDSIPVDMQPYTGSEVGRLRKTPLNEVNAYRAALIEKIVKNNAVQ